MAGAFFAAAFFAGALAATGFGAAARFLAGARAAFGAAEPPFQVSRAFFASATTLAMSSSLYTPLTPEMADSFMPCFRPSL